MRWKLKLIEIDHLNSSPDDFIIYWLHCTFLIYSFARSNAFQVLGNWNCYCVHNIKMIPKTIVTHSIGTKGIQLFIGFMFYTLFGFATITMRRRLRWQWWWWRAVTQFHYNNVQEHVTNFRSNGTTTTAYLLFSANNAMNASTNISMSHVTNQPTEASTTMKCRGHSLTHSLTRPFSFYPVHFICQRQ